MRERKVPPLFRRGKGQFIRPCRPIGADLTHRHAPPIWAQQPGSQLGSPPPIAMPRNSSSSSTEGNCVIVISLEPSKVGSKSNTTRIARRFPSGSPDSRANPPPSSNRRSASTPPCGRPTGAESSDPRGAQVPSPAHTYGVRALRIDVDGVRGSRQRPQPGCGFLEERHQQRRRWSPDCSDRVGSESRIGTSPLHPRR